MVAPTRIFDPVATQFAPSLACAYAGLPHPTSRQDLPQLDSQYCTVQRQQAPLHNMSLGLRPYPLVAQGFHRHKIPKLIGYWLLASSLLAYPTCGEALPLYCST
jgi:hypothetical protein